MNLKSKFKRILSGVLSLAVTTSILPCFPVFADEQTDPEKYPYTMFAASDSEGAITINANNFCVNGNIATNGTIISSGNMNVNGTRTENADEEMIHILKKLNYSYFSGDNVEVYVEDYNFEDLNININNPMDVYGSLELTGNINLNSGIKAYEDVTINGEVKNTNEAVICSETGDIIIETANVNFNGLIYAPYGDIIIDTDNLNLNNVVIIGQTITLDCPNVNANYSRNTAELVGTESDIDVELYALGEYNSEANSIDIEWYTNYSNSSYEIWISDDNEEYTSVGVVTDGTTYQYPITEDFEKRYFKVSLTTNYGEYIESIPFVVTKTESGYSVDFLDSDEDGLPDIYEIIIGTDINKIDSDDDDLTDYQEVYITGTDPTVYDSVTEGVSDADADSDEDGLSNIYEIEIGTSPLKTDTDDDDLSDYDELYIYGTEPLIPDTDGDGLEDGDEPHIGLDPTNPETFGIPDAEYKVEQTISTDSGVLSEINTAENAYELSIDIKTNGYAEKEVTVSKSGYSYAIENDAMIGLSADIFISDTCNPEEIVLKYNIKEAYIDNTLNLYSSLEEFQGIKRLNIFKFHEDKNMLLPVETKFDVENGLLYAEVDELGTYCIMDMEIWLNNLGVEMPEEIKHEENAMYFNSPSILSASEDSGSVWTSEITNAPLDIVFLLQAEGDSSSVFESDKLLISTYSRYLFDTYDDVRITIIKFGNGNSNIMCNKSGSMYLTSFSDVMSVMEQITYKRTDAYCVTKPSFEHLFNDVQFRSDSDRFIYKFINGRTRSTHGYDAKGVYSRKIGSYSEIFYSNWHYIEQDYHYEIQNAIAANNDLFICLDDDTLSKFKEHLKSKINFTRPVYSILLPTKWKRIALDGELSPSNGIDTDKDTLTDWEEVNVDELIELSDGNYTLPQVNIGVLVKTLSRYTVDRYLFITDNNKPIYYLPIISDPTEIDSDDDGLYDDEEYYLNTTALCFDTDRDGLSDGLEVELWFDPLSPNPDGDSFNDYEEWENGTSPFIYDYTIIESSEEIIKGALLGDFATADNTQQLIGQIAFSFVPFVADARDYFANIFVNLDTKAALVNLTGFLIDFAPVAGEATDVAKPSLKIAKYAAKYSDDAPKVVEAIIQAIKHVPNSDDVLLKLGKKLPSNVVESITKLVKNGDNLSKADYKKLCKALEAAGKNTDEIIEATKFKSFKSLKEFLGSPGSGNDWHHLVEQCQSKAARSGFDIKDINTVTNVKVTPKDVHKDISAFYSSKQPFTGGKTVRDWLNGQSYEKQYEFGLDQWEKFMKQHGYSID